MRGRGGLLLSRRVVYTGGLLVIGEESEGWWSVDVQEDEGAEVGTLDWSGGSSRTSYGEGMGGMMLERVL